MRNPPEEFRNCRWPQPVDFRPVHPPNLPTMRRWQRALRIAKHIDRTAKQFAQKIDEQPAPLLEVFDLAENILAVKDLMQRGLDKDVRLTVD